jgi:hypothetical protein
MTSTRSSAVASLSESNITICRDISTYLPGRAMAPEWTIMNLVIQAVTGVLGAHAAATVAHEHRFGFVGHSLVGLIAGALSGFFLQKIVMTTVTATGDAMPMTTLEAGVYQAFAGAAVGALAMMVVGFIRYEMTKSPGKEP